MLIDFITNNTQESVLESMCIMLGEEYDIAMESNESVNTEVKKKFIDRVKNVIEKIKEFILRAIKWIKDKFKELLKRDKRKVRKDDGSIEYIEFVIDEKLYELIKKSIEKNDSVNDEIVKLTSALDDKNTNIVDLRNNIHEITRKLKDSDEYKKVINYKHGIIQSKMVPINSSQINTNLDTATKQIEKLKEFKTSLERALSGGLDSEEMTDINKKLILVEASLTSISTKVSILSKCYNSIKEKKSIQK